jgi:hypothetical protein
MKLEVAKEGVIPPKVEKKAARLLEAYFRGEITAHKLMCSQGVSLSVGYSWRLLCRKVDERYSPSAWLLCSHARYNRYVRKVDLTL